MRRKRDVIGAELGSRDLQDHVRHSLANLGGGAVHLRAPVRSEPYARGGVVVEPFRVADVLEADREPDATPHTLAARRIAGPTGQTERIARQFLRLGQRERRGATFAVTAVELDASAPPSSRMRTRTFTSLPSRVARCSAQILAGWRWMWPTNDSSRL